MFQKIAFQKTLKSKVKSHDFQDKLHYRNCFMYAYYIYIRVKYHPILNS